MAIKEVHVPADATFMEVLAAVTEQVQSGSFTIVKDGDGNNNTSEESDNNNKSAE